MFDYYFTFRSITGAQQGERALMKCGISANFLRTPKYLSHNGCGYCLRVRGRDLGGTFACFQREQVPYSRVYRIGGDGVAQEVVP